MSLSVILQQMGVICILVFIGIFLQKKDVIDNLSSKKISAIVVDICNPALILASILGGNVTATHMDLLYALGLGVGLYAIFVILGFTMPRLLKVAPNKRKFYNLMCVYTNTGFLGIPIAKAILPPNAIIYVIVVNIIYALLFYTHGMAILGSGEDGASDKNGVQKRVSLNNLLNPGTVMAVITLIIFWFGIELPPILANTAEYVGNATVFLSMVLLGASIAKSDLFSSLKDVRIWIFILLRMVLLPILIVVALHAVSFDKTATLAMCLMSAVPVGNLPMIQAEKKGMDTSTLASAIAVTTTVSIITITVLIALATEWL
ncbi:MAG: AEC family transporter [Lachnospiraceae bacterium]|nr:AEC family transporter [Lachnospiraceae bacterium]